MRKVIILITFLSQLFFHVAGQDIYKPLEQSEQVIWGQGFGENSFVRFPASAQASIPADVWSNSQRSSGLQVRFTTNASSITVNYSIAGKYSNNSWYSDMGANGLDLYVRKPDMLWYWCYPTQRTVGTSFTYSQLDTGNSEYSNSGYEYRLYLPPFANTKTLTITVNSGAHFEFISVPENKKPIVVYGTSIVHGAVCSRPGNTWTNIVSRYMPEVNVVNFGFSGVGRMEEEVIRIIDQVDAEVYILDCLPNMTNSDLSGKVVSRYKKAVEILKTSHPDAKIILTEHPGYADEAIYLSRKLLVLEANNNLQKAYSEILKAGYEDIYYLSRDELGLDMAFHMGDYIHPNDAGMYRYADAYVQKLTAVTSTLENLDTDNSLTLLSINAGNGLSSGQYSLLNLNALIRNNDPDIIALQNVDFRTTDISGRDLVTELTYRLIQNGQKRQGLFTPIKKADSGEKGLGLIRRDCFEGTERVVLEHGLILHSINYTLKSGIQITVINCEFSENEETMQMQAEALVEYADRIKSNTIIATSINVDPNSKVIKTLERKFRCSCHFNDEKTYPASSPEHRYAYILTPLNQNWGTESVEIIGDESVSDHKGIMIKIGLKK